MNDHSGRGHAGHLVPKRFFPSWARRHSLLLILLVVLALHSLRTADVYLLSDDLRWVERTVSDAPRPWNAFGGGLFGDYYRPVPHLVWLVNYYLWGFHFVGHQFMFILMWLAAVVLVYAVGRRLGGLAAGLTAAALVGLNDVYLLIVSWKSWYTTVTEFVAVLAWAWCYIKWHRDRQTRHLVGWIALAVVGLFSRELAPLIISGAVLVTLVLPAFRYSKPEGSPRRALVGLVLWACVTAGALGALPSYRKAATAMLGFGAGTPSSDSVTRDRAVSLGYMPERFRSHARSMLRFGMSRYLLLFCILLGWRRALRQGRNMHQGAHSTLLGAFVIGAVALAVLDGARMWGEAGPAAYGRYVEPIMAAALLGGFLAVALAGDRWDRMLGVWFAAGFVPILFLQHASNAYHMLAFTALALYAGKTVSLFIRDAVQPVVARLLGRVPRRTGDEAQSLLVVAFGLLVLGQVVMLGANVRRVGPVIARRAEAGRAAEERVRRTVQAMLSAGSGRGTVWLGRGDYERIAALMLRERHGFQMRTLEGPGGSLVGLRTVDAPLRIYTDAIPYDGALFREFNAFPNPGFEQVQENLPLARKARSGKYSLAVRTTTGGPENADLNSSAFGLRPGVGYVFGGFIRREAREVRVACMALRSVRGEDYIRRTPTIRQTESQWELVWECAAPPEGSMRFALRALQVEGLLDGAVFVDDIFLCPVGPLIAAARTREPQK